MNILSIEAYNFLSYEKFMYLFKPKSVLVQGINKTDDNQESNGTGKTGFQAAIEYSIYGNTSQKVRDKDLIRFGQDEAYLKLIIRCDIRNETLTIERRIRRVGSSQLELMINDKKLRVATIADGNNIISEWIGISKEDLQNYYIINNKRYRSFFHASNTDKIQIISRFSNAHLIDGVIPKINVSIVELNEEIRDVNLERARLEGVIQTLNAELANTSSKSFADNKTKLLQDIMNRVADKEKQKRNALKIIDSETQNMKDNDAKILNIYESISETKTELNQIDLNPYKEQIDKENKRMFNLKEFQKDYNGQKKSREQDLQFLERKLSDINKNLMASVECPKCKFEFFPGNELADVKSEKVKKAKVENIISISKTKLEVIDLKLLGIEAQLTKVFEDLSEYEISQAKLNARVMNLRTTINNLELELTKIQSAKNISLVNVNEAEKLISIIDEQIKVIKVEYKEAEKSEYDKKTELNYQNKIGFHKRLIKECDKALIDLNQQLADTKQWMLNYKAFKGYLANQFLRVIEGLCNQFLIDLRSDIQVKWEGFKMKADGSMSERITPYVIRHGETRDFSSFSGGERARMEFALILTIRELINRAHPYGGLQFMFADEIFEGLDGLGLSHMMKTISEFNYPILVTTHVTDSNLYSDIVTIVKENGISRIYE